MVLMYKVSNASTRSAHNDLFTREYHRRFTRQQGKACVRRHGGGPCGGGETAALHEERAYGAGKQWKQNDDRQRHGGKAAVLGPRMANKHVAL